MKTINDYFYGYEKNDIEDIIEFLSPYEKEILYLKFGKNLDTYNKISDKKISDALYKRVLPKMRWYLSSLCKKYDSFIDYKVNLNDKLLALFKENKTANEICEILSISKSKLYEMILSLENNGFVEKRKYFSDGNITYKKCREISDNIDSQKKTILTQKDANSLKCMVISDIHVGNKLSDINLVSKVYDYAKKNNIHIILCTGDLIDGTFGMYEKTIENPIEQANYLIEKYPYDENILTFSILGDHDYSLIKRKSVDLINLLNNYRHDIVPINYYKGLVEIKYDLAPKKDYIYLYHKTFGKRKDMFVPIYLWGHSHKFNTKFTNDILKISVPSLSYLTSFPCALELTLNFSDSLIVNTEVKYIDFSLKGEILSTYSFDFIDRNEEEIRILK